MITQTLIETLQPLLCEFEKKRQSPGQEIFGLYSLDVEAEWELSTPFLKPLLNRIEMSCSVSAKLP